MSTLLTALFQDSKAAGDAVAALKNQGFADHISVVAKDENTGEVSSASVKDSPAEGMTTGAGIGGVAGVIAGILAGATAAVIPGIGLVVAGPLVTAVTGAVAGAVGGGIVGALVDKGIPDQKAKEYQDRIKQGEVLVAVDADDNKLNEASAILQQHGAKEITMPNA